MGLSTLNVFDDASQFRLLMTFYAVIEESGVTPNCSNAPELFFPEKKNSKANDMFNDTNIAKTACKTCPLLDACATYAIVGHERDGIWGGLTPSERNTIRKGIIRNKSTSEFTQKGYLGYFGIKTKVEQVPRSVSEIYND